MKKSDGELIIRMLHETARAINKLPHVSQMVYGAETDETIARMLFITLRDIVAALPAESKIERLELSLAIAFVGESISDRHAAHTQPATTAAIASRTAVIPSHRLLP